MRNLEHLSAKVNLTGGESVYCINESQMASAIKMMESQGEGSKLQVVYAQLRADLSRNEQAALAFMLINELRK